MKEGHDPYSPPVRIAMAAVEHLSPAVLIIFTGDISSPIARAVTVAAMLLLFAVVDAMSRFIRIVFHAFATRTSQDILTRAPKKRRRSRTTKRRG